MGFYLQIFSKEDSLSLEEGRIANDGAVKGGV